MTTPRVVILTGAGISQESGLPTFRDAAGLWEGYRPEEVASPLAFARMPDVVHEFYDLRRDAALSVQPNDAHRALARLERELDDRGGMLIVTQNIDDLHERAGSQRVVHIHGELNSALCTACGHRVAGRSDWATGRLAPPAEALVCGRTSSGSARTSIAWTKLKRRSRTARCSS